MSADQATTPTESAGEAGTGDDLPNLAVRFGQVFFSPGRLFDSLKENPAWLGPLMVVAVASLAVTLVIPEELMREAFIAQAPADAPAEQIDTMMRIGRWTGVAAAVVGPFLIAGILGGCLLFLYNMVLGGTATFVQLFSAAAHAMFVPMVGGLITTPLAIAAGDLNTALALHLLVPGLGAETYMYRFLHGLNVFSLGTAVVLGIAVSRLYPRRSAGSAAFTLVGLYVAVKAVVAAFGGFG